MKPCLRRGAPRTLALAAAVTLLASGCASLKMDDNFGEAARYSREHGGAEARWLRDDASRRDTAAAVEHMLAQPLSADDAVRIALGYSPAFQALLADSAAASADATAGARLPNPVFAFERLVRREGGEAELDIGRSLSVSLLDLVLLPTRLKQAESTQRRLRAQLSATLVMQAADARQAWVRAVAAEQALRYREQVGEAAEAGAELARRMRATGSFSLLQQSREQAFHAEAVAETTRARQQALAAREALVRLLGLPPEQAARLRLPERLPELPAQIASEQESTQAGLDQRLDLRILRANLDRIARDAGLSRVTSIVDGLTLGGAVNDETGKPTQRGYEVEVPLPLFDFGDARRAGAEARYLAALNRNAQAAVEAHSRLRESYAAYRSNWQLARHYRDEVVPLRKRMSEEMAYAYNGMLIGVFELLADARSQVAAVAQALDAQRDFWLADAALQAERLGAPTLLPQTETTAAAPAEAAAGH